MNYFSIEELSNSKTAAGKGIDNTPTPSVIEALTALVDNVLDPLRKNYGKPIRINSGYRSPELNEAVKGAKNSQHTKGEAADITAGNKTENEILFKLILSLELPFCQLINENDFSWIHVSYKKDDNRRQILKIG